MKSKVSKRQNGNEQQMVARLYKNVQLKKTVYTRWMSGTEATISTSAGGVVALATVANAAVVNTLADFASVAALYTAYRCKAIRVEIFPHITAPVYNGAAAITKPPVVAFYPWTSNSVPTTFAQALDCPGLKTLSGYQKGTISTSWMGDPDAHLWTATSAAIGSNEQFGVSCIGGGSAVTASAPVFQVIPHYLVEFRMTG